MKCRRMNFFKNKLNNQNINQIQQLANNFSIFQQEKSVRHNQSEVKIQPKMPQIRQATMNINMMLDNFSMQSNDDGFLIDYNSEFILRQKISDLTSKINLQKIEVSSLLDKAYLLDLQCKLLTRKILAVPKFKIK